MEIQKTTMQRSLRFQLYRKSETSVYFFNNIDIYRRRLGSASTFSLHVFLPHLLILGTDFAFVNSIFTIYILCKNESHDTIDTFKNYFATVFSVFSNNKFNPNTPYSAWKEVIFR